VDGAGTPIKGALVRDTAGTNEKYTCTATATTDDDGRFELNVLGVYEYDWSFDCYEFLVTANGKSVSVSLYSVSKCPTNAGTVVVP
jgi:hypothetical protein